MSGSAIAGTARKIACPRCHVSRFDHCIGPDGVELFHAHPERCVAARSVHGLTPSHVDALRKLHADPTRTLHPAIRETLIKRGFIEQAPAVPPPRGGRYLIYPKRSHPLTDAGRAAILELP